MAANADIVLLASGSRSADADVVLTNLNGTYGRLVVSVTAADSDAAFQVILKRVSNGFDLPILTGQPIQGLGQYEYEVGPNVDLDNDDCEKAKVELPRALKVSFKQCAPGSKAMTFAATLHISQ